MNLPSYILPTEYQEFFHILDACEQEIELVTQEGFHLNLKSKLAQYVAMIHVFQNKKIRECRIITHSRQDMIRIISCFVLSENK